MISVNPGKMRHRIELQANNSVTDAAGQEIANWETYDTVWGSISPLKGREFADAEQLKTSETTHRIVIRFNKFITTKHRLYVDKSRPFEVDSIRNLEEREILQELICKETVKGG